MTKQRLLRLRFANSLILLLGLFLPPSVFGQVSGKVFNDYNASATQISAVIEPGVAGVTVTAFKPDGTSVTTTTGATGTYAFTAAQIASGTLVRIEFTGLPTNTFDGIHSATAGNSATTVQFATAGAATTNINLGLSFPFEYCQDNPLLMTPCYVNGSTSSAGLNDVLLSWPYNNTGTVTTGKSTEATKSQIGSVWGLAYSKNAKKVYSATVLKRHVGVLDNDNDGFSDLGAIYVTNSVTNASSLFITIPNAGTIGNDAARGLDLISSGSADPDALSKVIKVGLGDLDITPDETTLYVVNLNDKKLYKIDIATATITDSYLIPDPCNAANGQSRPFGLSIYKDEVYVGVVCDASISGLKADLSATVYKLSGGTFTSVLTFPLNYAKQNAANVNPGRGGWYGWSDDYATISFIYSGARRVEYPQPVLSDIAFDNAGNMAMGFIDRTGFIGGYQNIAPLSMPTTGTSEYITINGGDMLRATVSGGVYTLESSPGGTSEFFDDIAGVTDHMESTLGGIAYNRQQSEFVSSVFDPLNTLQSAGIKTFSESNGTVTASYQVFAYDNIALFGKGTGLGDVELGCDPAPIEIGNRVWKDTDKDGFQDPNESVLVGVTVQLYDSLGVLVPGATAVTDAKGVYIFSSQTGTNTASNIYGLALLPHTKYQISVTALGANVSVAGLRLVDVTPLAPGETAPLNTGATLNNNDAKLVSNIPTIVFQTGGYGENNHTLDFAFSPCVSPSFSVSQTIATCNGIVVQNDGSVTITSSGDKYSVGTTTTYVDATAFTGSFTVSNLTQGSSLTLRVYNGVQDCYLDTTITILTQLCPASTCSTTIGGTVFNDFNNNGTYDTTDSIGLTGIKVYAYNCAGVKIDSATTDYRGRYTFANVTSANDTVRVEFATATFPAGAKPTYNGTNGRTDVQFVKAPNCSVNLGLTIDYCQTNPNFSVVCFTRNNDPTTEPTIIFMNNNSTRAFTPNSTSDANSTWGLPSGATAVNYPIPTKYEASNTDEVGSTYGLAWDKYNQKLYTGSYMRAFSPMKANGSANGFGEGIIYQIPINGNTSQTPSVWLDLETLLGDGIAGVYVADGAYPGPAVFGRTGSNPNKIGYTGLGSIEISKDGTELYTVNLNTQEVYVIPIGTDGTAPTNAASIKKFPIPDSDCAGTWADGRPKRTVLGLGLHPVTGRLYVSTTCTGTVAADLKGSIYSFDPKDNTPAATDFTKELDIPLDIMRPATSPNTNSWWNQVNHPWESVTANVAFYNNDPTTGGNAFNQIPQEQNSQHNQPWLGEIGFDLQKNGTYGLVVAERNRYHDLINGSFYVTGGVVFKAWNAGNNTTPNYVLENNKIAGDLTSIVNWTYTGNTAGANTSSTNRFFKYVGREGTFGAGTLDIIPGSSEVFMPVMDNVFNSSTSGITWLSTVNGNRLKDNRILGDFTGTGYNITNFTKANNWGEIEAMCALQPIQIGNRIWVDTDRDGVQDPCNEPTIPNIVVSLYDKAGNFIAKDTTNALGEYYFDETNVVDTVGGTKPNNLGPQPNTQYYIVIGKETYGTAAQFDKTTSSITLSGKKYELTTQNSTTNSGNDQNDNDFGIANASTPIALQGYPVLCATTPSSGSDHTFDAGFATVCNAPIISTVFADTATCTNSIANNDAAVHVTGISGMTKYAYGTNGTTGLFYANATASTGTSIDLTGLTNPSVPTIYTFRIYGVDTTCYNDTTVLLNPSVCLLPCSITATFLQNPCNNNGTTAIATDDYFTVTVSGVSSTNGGTSGKYEVILNGTVLNTGGTAYGTSVTVGTTPTFLSDGTTTYQLTVRDLDIPTCVTPVFITTASASCSTVPCPTVICVPVTVTRAN